LYYAKLLSLITLEAAQAVGLGHEIGSLEPGKCADIVAFGHISWQGQRPELSQVLADIFEKISTCRLLMVDGQVVVRDGRLVYG
jgi:5-methylthioadenosine/S-adenosylhomocysteine deaminase